MSHKIIDGKKQAQIIKDEVRGRVNLLKELGWQPRLISMDVGDSPAVSLYIKNQQRACAQVGIEFEHHHYPGNITQREMLAAIHALNADPRVTGIILQRPVPLDLEELENAIHHTKDVEGMSSANIGNIVYGDSSLGPCTSLAAVELLRSTGLELRGLEVVVVGHSEIVGKPVALLLVEDLATVTICHHATRNLIYHTRQADALFVAVGKPGLITADMVKPGAAVIDIGINQVDVILPDGTHGTKIVGDVDFEGVHQVAGWITPVPGGVGPMTVAMLLRNTVVATERQRNKYEEADARMNCRITHIGTATLLLEIGPIRLLTDPAFDPPGGNYNFGYGTSSTKLTAPAIRPEDIGKIDTVLLSHDQHDDNLDQAGRALLPLAGKVLTTNAAAKRLGNNAIGLQPWQSTTIKSEDSEIKVTAVPARHGSLWSHIIVGETTGFVLEWDDQKHGALYISGDTVWFNGIHEIADRFKIGTAILHIGKASFPATGPIRFTFHAKESVRAIKTLNPRIVIPVHYEGWKHFREPREEAEKQFAAAELGEKVQWLPLGVPVNIEI